MRPINCNPISFSFSSGLGKPKSIGYYLYDGFDSSVWNILALNCFTDLTDPRNSHFYSHCSDLIGNVLDDEIDE